MRECGTICGFGHPLEALEHVPPWVRQATVPPLTGFEQIKKFIIS
jgi:hypothetical protein